VRVFAPFAAFVLPFLILATLNSAGYRYGASDQAFYAPAVLARMDPALFPRDAGLIASQAQLTLVDDVIGPIARVLGLPLPQLFAALQILTLTLLAFAVARVGAAFYRSPWTVVALMAALTLRHAIIKSGTNTLEGYFHPRQLAFACGALAVGSFLRAGHGAAAAALVIATALHPTTGCWFAVWLGIATFVAEPRLRIPVLGAAALCGAALAWALTWGPLAGRFVLMDDAWLATLGAKDYLFPLKWPASAWLVNLAYVPIIAVIHRQRRAADLVAPRERALVIGCLSLGAVFALTIPLNAARVALAIQLQPARMFWMLDFLAAVYVVWAAAEANWGSASASAGSTVRARIVAAAIVAVALVRGVYIMQVEFPDRRVAQVDITDDDWGRAMAWARASDRGSGWIADPEHAVRYGTSVRVAGHRDVFVEAIKDVAVGMYDRNVAMRTRDRVAAMGDFASLDATRARQLAQEYALDYLVTERTIDLPLAFTSGKIRIYRVR
jgi:hypothetical protein